MKEYEITYQSNYVGREGWIHRGPEFTYRCRAKSESAAWKRLVNLEAAHQFFEIKRILICG